MRCIFIYITLSIILFSCKQEECENYIPGGTVLIDSTMNALKFKTDSYWVYENPVTSELDSQVVIYGGENNFVGAYPSECEGSVFVHEYRMIIQSFLNNKEFDYLIINAGLIKDTTSGDFHGGRFIYAGTDIYLADSGAELIATIPILNLNANNFYNVKKIWIKVLPSWSPLNLSDHDMHYYFVDSIGLVKWEVFDSTGVLESWDLKTWQTSF